MPDERSRKTERKTNTKNAKYLPVVYIVEKVYKLLNNYTVV